jgi:manganese/iron transport system substrate-binding protein
MRQRWRQSKAWQGSLVLSSVVLGIVGCAQSTPDQVEGGADPGNALPQVVVTSRVLCDLTGQIAGDTIALTCLLEPGQDPHTYQARPSDRQAIDQADLVLYGGYHFAPSLANLVEASRNPAPQVKVFEAAIPQPLLSDGHDHGHDDQGDEAPHPHDGADVHKTDVADHADHADDSMVEQSMADPHVWHSARNNAALVQVIADQLALVAPDQAEVYAATADQLATQFTTLDDWIQTQVNTIPASNRKLVTTHQAFGYFADAYGLEVMGALSGLSTDEKPSAGSLTALVEQVRTAGVPAIFAESTTNPDLIISVARDAGVVVAPQPLYVSGPGGPGTNAETTQAMLVANTCTIVNALGGTCTEAEAPL